MAWHHIAGLTGGFFAGRGPAREAAVRYGGSDGRLMPAGFLSKPKLDGFAAVEARFVWLGGAPHAVLTGRDGERGTLYPATGIATPKTKKQKNKTTRRLRPNAARTRRQRLEAPD